MMSKKSESGCIFTPSSKSDNSNQSQKILSNESVSQNSVSKTFDPAPFQSQSLSPNIMHFDNFSTPTHMDFSNDSANLLEFLDTSPQSLNFSKSDSYYQDFSCHTKNIVEHCNNQLHFIHDSNKEDNLCNFGTPDSDI